MSQLSTRRCATLILKRLLNERITLTTVSGETIVVVLTEAEKGFARIGIDAPASVKIMRNELLGFGTEWRGTKNVPA